MDDAHDAEPEQSPYIRLPWALVAGGLAAVLGSSRSIFLGFGGGRGVGTGVGTMLVIQPLALLLATPVFIGVILLTRYVSLGSLLASAAMLPVMLLFLVVAPGTPLWYVLYAAVGAGFTVGANLWRWAY